MIETASISFSVYGSPVAKGRPNVAFRGKYPVMYTPSATRAAEESFIQQAIKYKPETPWEGPISITFRFYKIKPPSMSKKVKEWTKKPDLDNLIKLSLDAMNKIFFQDDSQIVEIIARKEYSDTPRTYVEIRKK